MPVIIEPPEAGAPARPLWKRLAWFFGLAVAAACATAGVAYALRAFLRV